MIAAYITGAVSGVEVLGPSVLAVFTSSTGSTGADIVIAAALDGEKGAVLRREGLYSSLISECRAAGGRGARPG